MARLTDMMMTYFVTGALMWAAGYLEWTESDVGLADFLLTVGSGNVTGDESVRTNLTDMGGPIGNIVNTLGGGLLAVWNVIENLVDFVFWPITTLQATGAPPEVVVLMGGPPTLAFFGGFILLVRGSA